MQDTSFAGTSLLRADLETIAELIPHHARVLDIGCGEGDLLAHMVQQKNIDGRGIELLPMNVSTALNRGLTCIQGNADTDLVHYPDSCFDYAVSSNTLQATVNPKTVLSEMLRIARHVVISLPNFGYWYNRFYLLTKGRMPVSETLSYEWYETPNIHFCTLKDFIILCEELECVVDRIIYLSASGQKQRTLFHNLLSEHGVFLLRRP